MVVTPTIFFLSLINHPMAADRQFSINIESGESFDEIASKLQDEQIIYSKTLLKIYSLFVGKAHQFKSGYYIFDSQPSIRELVDILVVGPKQISITIVPGMTLNEIDDELSSVGFIKSGGLIGLDIESLKDYYPYLESAKSLEGFLLPDTYYFSLGSKNFLVARKILDNFKLKALPLFSTENNIQEKIILASILEKEVPNDDDRKLVAGILIKRLEVGMPLQVDASVVYFTCGQRYFDCPALEKADFKTDSPFNTYLYKGLPYHAISNPDLEAIKAALEPQKSAYWYYLSDPKTQKTIFSKTLDEHNANRAIYLNK